MNYQGNVEFFKRVTEPLQGWLLPQAAIRTLDLLDWQVANRVRGGLLEIGVFCGKYFSLLLHSANAAKEKILGVDTFEFAPQNQVLDLLGRNGADARRVQMIQRSSADVTAAEIIACLGGSARFISVDGSHLKPGVLNDLRLSDQVLSDQGIVAADDFLNCLCMGVAEAILAFLPASKSWLVPFAYIPNKLLLCRPAMRDTYAKVLEAALLAHPYDAIGEQFKNTHGQDRNKVFTELVGSPVLVAS
jgi:hypothetical protein